MILFAIWVFVFMACAVIYIFYKLFKFGISNIYQGSVELYRYLKVTKPMIENGFIEKKLLEERMIAEEKRLRDEKYLNEKKERMIRAGINKTQELRIKYPLADEKLFKFYLQKYPTYLLHELQMLEDNIRFSHSMNGETVR